MFKMGQYRSFDEIKKIIKNAKPNVILKYLHKKNTSSEILKFTKSEGLTALKFR
jgi:tRNA nucleotidyltransferase/poly(A) polymerase